MEHYELGKVKRLHSACCGMEDGKIYTAKIGWSYVSVQLPDMSWTSEHWAGFGSDNPLFEIITKNGTCPHCGSENKKENFSRSG